MADTIPATLEFVEERVVRIADDPITFDQFVRLDLEGHVELIDGILVARMVAFLNHEDIEGWLNALLRAYVRHRGLGVVLGSRTAVEIDRYHARLPDILFVRQERSTIVEQDGVHGAPDLVIEIISPNDRRSDIASLEADYRSIAVPEIWFVDQRRKLVRAVTSEGDGYVVRELADGTLCPTGIPGLAIEVAWLFQQPLPNEYAILRSLLG
jgi:Uma2 family endonuclease